VEGGNVFCSRCGTQIPNDVAFCQKCGTAIASGDLQAERTAPQAVAEDAEEIGLGDLADEDGVLRVRAEPGPSMRWFEQGFYLGLGFTAATAVIWIFAAALTALVIMLNR
jgi:hypothetical protein